MEYTVDELCPCRNGQTHSLSFTNRLLFTFLKLDFDFWLLCFNNKGKDAAWTRSMSEWPNKGTMCQYWARDNTHCAPQNIVLKSAFVCKNQRQCQVHNNQFSTAATVSIQVQCLQQKVGCAVQPWTLGHQQPYLHPHNQNHIVKGSRWNWTKVTRSHRCHKTWTIEQVWRVKLVSHEMLSITK